MLPSSKCAATRKQQVRDVGVGLGRGRDAHAPTLC